MGNGMDPFSQASLTDLLDRLEEVAAGDFNPEEAGGMRAVIAGVRQWQESGQVDRAVEVTREAAPKIPTLGN